MADTRFVAVEATDERYRALKHIPSGESLDAETGRGRWPADSFTFALKRDGTLRFVEGGDDAAANKPAKKGS